MVDLFDKYTNAVSETDPIKFTGRVVRVHDKLIESEGPVASENFARLLRMIILMD